MIIIGLTGSIGMGKSTAARQFRALRVPVCDADALVHALMRKGGAAVAPIMRLFPGVIANGAVNRKALGDIVFHNKAQMRDLEAVLHPLVIAAENRFIDRARRKGAKLVVLDIPLLFETGGDERCDMVAVVTAPREIQRQRVLRRPNMTAEKFAAIEKAQMSNLEKCRRADMIIPTGLGKHHSFRAIAGLVRTLRSNG